MTFILECITILIIMAVLCQLMENFTRDRDNECNSSQRK